MNIQFLFSFRPSDPLTWGSAPGPRWGTLDPHHSEEIAATDWKSEIRQQQSCTQFRPIHFVLILSSRRVVSISDGSVNSC